MMQRNKWMCFLSAAGLFASAAIAPATAGGPGGQIGNVQIGPDNNSAENPIVQPQDPALSGGGIDQTLQFGDVLLGGVHNDLLIGGLGIDILAGNLRNDVLIGGTEHFNPLNRDRAFGGRGQDVFIWAPGDGSDLFRGGSGQDAVVFGLIGEVENGETVFRVSNDQQAGEIFLDPATRLPLVDVANSPGFCEVETPQGLEELDLDHLVRFSLRAVRDAFEAGEQDEDNGLRVTLHLKDVEVLVCTNREGGEVEILDLTTSPPQLIDLSQLHPALRDRLEAMILSL